MGLLSLFKRKKRDPVVLPEVERRILLRAEGAALEAQMRAYDGIAGSFGPAPPLQIGGADGWLAVELPRQLHPWAFHNLAMWLLDTSGVGAQGLVALACADGLHPGYFLVDDEVSDWLSGYDDEGQSVTVAVPANDITRGEALDLPTTRAQVLDRYGVPAGLDEAPIESLSDPTLMSFRFEHPGADLNPTSATTAASREALRARGRGTRRF